MIVTGLVCLVLGAAGAMAYSHFLGEGRVLVDLQMRFDELQASLDKVRQHDRQSQQETTALTAQVQQLSASKDTLQKQVDDLKTQGAPPADIMPKGLPANFMTNILKSHLDQQRDQRFQMLKSRLRLTPDQETALKAAMDSEEKMQSEGASALLNGGKIDPSAYKGLKTVDQTLNEILSPDQKTAYQQLKTDEKNSSAEMMASVQMNQVAPMLQLNDAQKDQMVSALEQVQLSASDPAWIKANVTNMTDPAAILQAQQKARNDALAKILSPDQLATYEQQAQAQLTMQQQMMQQFHPGAGSPAAATTTAAPAPVSP